MYFAKLLPRVCHTVNRVCYIFGHRHEGSALTDVTPTFLTPLVIATAREADHAANDVLRASGTMSAVSQMPVVLIPLHFGRSQIERAPSCQRSVVLRPFITNDFMTGVPAVPGKHLPEDVVLAMVAAIMEVDNISRVLYDLTAKPPGTTEWE